MIFVQQYMVENWQFFPSRLPALRQVGMYVDMYIPTGGVV
jgi:hypothetical protein